MSPLLPYQQLVTGRTARGPRETVVDTRPGAVLPSYILRLDLPIDPGMTLTRFIDTGELPTQTPQLLPDLVANVAPDYSWLWPWLAAGVALWVVLQPRRRGAYA